MRPDIKGIVFDLDGTLLNTLPTLAAAFNGSLEQMGFPAKPVNDFRHIIGDGAHKAAMRCLPAPARTEDKIAGLMGRFEKAYRNIGQKGTRPYDGITEAVTELGGRLPLAVLSNKDAVFSAGCIEHFFAEGTFVTCIGYGGDVKHKPHPSGAKKIAEHLGCHLEELVMIGDTATDMRTALACNMLPVGVLWGFRDERELTGAGARFLVEAPRQLPALIRDLGG